MFDGKLKKKMGGELGSSMNAWVLFMSLKMSKQIFLTGNIYEDGVGDLQHTTRFRALI